MLLNYIHHRIFECVLKDTSTFDNLSINKEELGISRNSLQINLINKLLLFAKESPENIQFHTSRKIELQLI
jgi:hypothetical protein